MYEHVGDGNLWDLSIKSTRSAVWVGPAWAVVCGAVASGALSADWRSLILLPLAVILADPVLGTAWGLASRGRGASPASAQGNPGGISSVPSLPYTLPGSLVGRFGQLVAGSLSRWRSSAGERGGRLLLELAFVSALALLLAGVLGEMPALVVLAALAAVYGRLVAGQALGWLEGILATAVLAGIPWLLGYVTFARLWGQGDWMDAAAGLLVRAAVYALAFYACVLISREVLVRGCRLLAVAHGVGILFLIVAKEPVLAGGMALLFLPQAMLQPLLLRLGDGRWYLRRAQIFAMLAMLALSMRL